MTLFLYEFIGLEAVLGFFGVGFEMCQKMACVCAHRLAHSATYYWDMNPWALDHVQGTASSTRDDEMSKASAVS